MSRPVVATPAGWRAAVLCAAFGGGVGLAVLAHASLALAAAVMLLGVGTAVLARCAGVGRRALLLALVALACSVGVVRGAQAGRSASTWLTAVGNGPSTLAGVVREGTGSRRSAAQVVVDVDRVVGRDGESSMHLGVLAALRNGPTVLPGDAVQLSVKGLRPPGAGTIGDILSREGVDAVAQSPALTVQAEGGPSPVRVLAVVRGRLAAAVDAALPEPAASLLESIVFGMRRQLPADLTTALQDSGLAHILAVSGLKVVLVAGLVSALCTALTLAPRVRLLATGIAVGGYVVLCGAGAAAVRSALMAGAGWGLQGTGRVPDPVPLLAATAAAMLAVDPGLAGDTGFQLSILGTLGIVLLAGPISHRMPGPRWFREPLAMTVAAELFTLPVQASAFGVVSLIGPVANAVAVPLLPPLIVMGGMGAAVAAALPAVGTAALAAGGGLALLIGDVATHAAALPFAAIHVSGWPPLYVTAELAALAAAGVNWWWLRSRIRHAAIGPLLPPPGPAPEHHRDHTIVAALRHALVPRGLRLRRSTAIAAACAAALATGATVVIAGTRPDGRLHIAVLGVGSARAVVIRTSAGGNALVDTGSDPQRLLQELGPALPPLARSLDLLVLTGGDKGAVGGLSGLADRYTIARAIVPADGLGSAVRTTLASLRDRGTDVEAAPPDTAWTWGGATWRLLSPDGAWDEGSALDVTDPTGSLLLLGNLTVAAQEELAALRGRALAAELLVTPPSAAIAHPILDATHPRLIAVPDARGTRTALSSALSGRGVRHTGSAGTLTYIGSEGGLTAT